MQPKKPFCGGTRDAEATRGSAKAEGVRGFCLGGCFQKCLLVQKANQNFYIVACYSPKLLISLETDKTKILIRWAWTHVVCFSH